MVQQNINDTCPVMAVQYFCNCTTTTTAVSKAVQPLTVTPGVMSAQLILISGLSQSTTDSRLHTTSSIGLPVYSDVSKAVQSLIATPGVMQQMSSQSRSILTSGSTEISTDPRFRTTASIGLSISSDVSKAVQPLIATPSVLQQRSSQSSSILLSGSTAGSVVANNKTGNNISVEERKITGAENCDENLQTSTFSVKWWIFVIVISGSLFAVNIVVSVCLYKSEISKRARQNEVQPN